MSDTGKSRRSRMMLWTLLAIFFVPLFGAVYLYRSGWRPQGQTNHGQLIQPPRVLVDVNLPRADGQMATHVLHGKWSLVYIGTGSCDADCHATLYYTRQTRTSLGRLMPRVQRVFLATSGCCDRPFLEREHPDLETLVAQGPAATALLAQFPADARAYTIFIVDPHGNLMMRYDAHSDPKGLREDLKKLLGLSQIG